MKRNQLVFQLAFVVTLICLTAIVTEAQTDSPNLAGSWSGTLVQTDPKGASDPISIAVSPDASGNLYGMATLDSKCVKNPRLKVKVTTTAIAFVGSDSQGDSLSLRGTLDNTGRVLTMTFTANGSASGRCESVRGTATLQKQ